ncbi:MAG: hypothetical protein GC159_23310 [Phycisphaera sp.]|nr:hypothetical protein [Phycisphaera sp.]
MTTREQFLKHISRALGREHAPTEATAPEVPDDLARLVSADEDADALVERFVTNAAAVGMIPQRVITANLAAAIVDVLKKVEAKTVSIATEHLPDAEALCATIEHHGVEIVPWLGDREMKAMYNVDVGITDVDAAIAETGSIICNSGATRGRGLSLVPPYHIAVVHRSRIVADLLDYLRPRRGDAPAELPSGQAIITGPSKTADIEGVLIQGVHGPADVYLLVVDDA